VFTAILAAVIGLLTEGSTAMPHWNFSGEDLARQADDFEDVYPEPDNIFWWLRVIGRISGFIAAMALGALFMLLVMGRP
jgi:hypothetical protein